MSYPLEGPLPQIDLQAGATVTINAVDPTTGATVTGVVFSDGVIYAAGHDQGDGDAPIESMFLLPTGD